MLLKLFYIFTFVLICHGNEKSCPSGTYRQPRYLLYDVNSGEGFNLRRDVYIRVANLVRKLREFDNYILVLPPWGNLYHWRNTERNVFYEWGNYFDMKCLSEWVPVIELEEYIKETEGATINSVFVLQSYAEGWEEKGWTKRFEKRPCIEKHQFRNSTSAKFQGHMWGKVFSIDDFSCISFQGMAANAMPLIRDNNARSVMISRAEVILHDTFGGKEFWGCRSSMRPSYSLRDAATEFLKEWLTWKPQLEQYGDCRNIKGSAPTSGGPYIAVHLRRRDFLQARPDQLPSLLSAAKQLQNIANKYKTKAIFVATDAPEDEYDTLQSLLKDFKVKRFSPSKKFLSEFGDGGAVIVDQMICALARCFVGSFESTFSFRIQEDREILNYASDTTFNRLCSSNQECSQPSKWTIVY